MFRVLVAMFVACRAFGYSFKVHCKAYSYDLNGGQEGFANMYGQYRKRRGVYIKIENLSTQRFGIGEAPIPFFYTAGQSAEEEQTEIDLVEDLCSSIRAEAESFRYARTTAFDRQYVSSFKRTEQWVMKVCRRMKQWSQALKNSLTEAVLCACLGLVADDDDADRLRRRYEAYYVLVNPWEMKVQLSATGHVDYPEVLEMLPCRALKASDWIQRKEWKVLEGRVSASQPADSDGSMWIHEQELCNCSSGDGSGWIGDGTSSVKSLGDCCSRPSLFTTDFASSDLWFHRMCVRGTWETGIGLAHLALTAAHVGTNPLTKFHLISAFPRKWTGDSGSIAERVTAQFIQECVRSKRQVTRSELRSGTDREGNEARSYIDIAACSRFLKSVDPFAEPKGVEA